MNVHVHAFSVSVCVSGSASVYCSMHGHVYERLNDHGLSVWGLPPQEARAAHWKSSLTCFLCLSFPLSVALSGWENTNRGAAFVKHKSPLPLKLPAPLFSCPNSTAIKLSWQEFRKQLRREKDGGEEWVGGKGGTPPSHTSFPPFPFLLSSGYQWSVLLLTTLNKDLTSYLFSLLIRFPQSVYWFLQRVTTRWRSAAVPLLLFLRHVCFHPPSELGWYKPWSD